MNWARTSDGLEIYYQDSGGQMPVLVFQSGYMGIHDIWKFQIEALADQFRCIAFDNRGYGLSSSPPDPACYTTENNADDLKAVLDACGVTAPVVLVTHSLGGTNALAFAMRYPETLRGILMMGGAAASGVATRARGANDEMYSAQQTTPLECMTFYAKLGLREDIAIEAAKWPSHVFRNQTAAFLDFDPGDALPSIAVPVLVLHGTDDVVTPVDFPREIAESVANGRLQMLEGCNHFPQTEKPDVVNEVIRAFAEEVGAHGH